MYVHVHTNQLDRNTTFQNSPSVNRPATVVDTARTGMFKFSSIYMYTYNIISCQSTTTASM